jgi:hypothetical protein
MWSSVLGLAFLSAFSPLRLGVTLLVISRPRPVQNLFAFWVGNLIVSVPYLLVPLMLLHVIPMFSSFTRNLATSPTVRHIQFGMGVLALSIAALMTARFVARQRAQLPTPSSNTSTLVLDSNTPTAISRLLRRTQDAPTEGGSAIRRLLGRAHTAWESGSLWVALVIGVGMTATVPDLFLLALAIIVASGAALCTQISAAIAFVVMRSAVEEIALVSYLAMPAKTQALVRLLHDWARVHRRKVLVAILAVVGVSLVAQGVGSV